MRSTHALPSIWQELASTPHGLSEAEAQLRLSADGSNELPEHKRSFVVLFAHQFNDVLVYILIAALLLSIVLPFFEGGVVTLRSFFDAFVILVILMLNAVLGFMQEYKAEEAIAGLRKLSSPHCRIRRDGIEKIVPSRELVRGDVVIIEAGDRIAADGIVVVISHLEVNESSLTGESQPQEKSLKNQETRMVSAGTLVTRGSAEYCVSATGIRTRIGAIAKMVSETESRQTPLQDRMKRLSVFIGGFVLILCAGLVLLGLWRGLSLVDLLLFGVSLAVSAVPEGLPAVVTVCLALGVRRMTRKNVIVRKLQALETLGSVTVICSDKTGTITENRMTVKETWVGTKTTKTAEALLLRIAASCNRAVLPDLGDPTEIGLLVYAKQQGIERLGIEEEEVPFSSEDKYMQTRHGDEVFLKGAPEKIAALCSGAHAKEALLKSKEMAGRGLRVLACAVRHGRKMQMVGLIAMEDPPRIGMPEAVAHAKRAGIRTIMITGDGLETAQHIARVVGIEGEGMDGKALDELTPLQLRETVRTVSVYARVSPAHKLAILGALQANGETVAMSGDGVNDAPALKGADVGVAMGKNGTEVAREAASIVLTDDNYATIVTAIREGRHLYDNIRKFILFLMHTNFYELVFFAVAIGLDLPMPYLPVHILWINLMTDGLPALALGVEGEEPNLMERPPRARSEHLFTGMWGRLTLGALVPFAVSLILFLWELSNGKSVEEARTLTFTFAILFEIFFTFSIRSSRPFWRHNPFGNSWLLGAVAVPLLLQILLLGTPLRIFFHLTVLHADQWWLLTGLVVGSLLFFELLKVVDPIRSLMVRRS